MRLKSANAGARPHLFRKGINHGSPEGANQNFQKPRLMSGAAKQLILPGLNENGGESQAAPDAAASYGQQLSPNAISPELAA